MTEDIFLPGLPVSLIVAAYEAAPGNEIASGKFASLESSAALVANAFGFFLGRADLLPPLPGTPEKGWPASSLALEALVRFPWSGGKHPCLDVLIATGDSLIGVESKRFEPFRSKGVAQLSDAYWRPLWGDAMAGYERVRDDLKNGLLSYKHLDATQLIKHAFGLRTAVQVGKRFAGRRPVLFYLFAESKTWPDGKDIADVDRLRHREEIEDFRLRTADSEVAFVSCCYNELLDSWLTSKHESIRKHAIAVAARFRP